MEKKRITDSMMVPAGLLLLWVLSACFCMAATTVVVDETFDSVADVTFTTDTAGPIVNTDEGNWSYSLGPDGGQCGFSGGKAVRLSDGTGVYEDSIYIIIQQYSSPIAVDSYNTLTVSFTLNSLYVGAHGGLISNVNLKDSGDNNIFMIQHRSDTRSWEWFVYVGTTGATLVDKGILLIGHEFQVTVSYTPVGDGTTNVDYDIVDLTDGTGSISGVKNLANTVAGALIDETYITIGTKTRDTFDNYKITGDDGASAVSDWLMY